MHAAIFMKRGGETSLMKWKVLISASLALILALPSLAGVGLESLLYENFESISPPALPSGWSIQNPGGDPGAWGTRAYGGVTWGRQCIRYKGDPGAPANDWFFTLGVQLAAGEVYEIVFMTRVSSAMQPYNLGVWAGMAQNPADMTLMITDVPVGWTEYEETGADFIAPGTGTYYFGFYCTAPPNPFRLLVDDVRVMMNENELQLGLGMVKPLYEDPPVFNVGDDTVSAFVYLKNAGPTATVMNTRFAVGKWPSDTEIQFMVFGPDGLERPIINMFSKSRPAGASDFYSIQPDSTAGKVVNLWNWYEFDMIGDYTIWAIYRNYSDPGGLGAWTGQLESDPVIITVQ